MECAIIGSLVLFVAIGVLAQRAYDGLRSCAISRASARFGFRPDRKAAAEWRKVLTQCPPFDEDRCRVYRVHVAGSAGSIAVMDAVHSWQDWNSDYGRSRRRSTVVAFRGLAADWPDFDLEPNDLASFLLDGVLGPFFPAFASMKRRRIRFDAHARFSHRYRLVATEPWGVAGLRRMFHERVIERIGRRRGLHLCKRGDDLIVFTRGFCYLPAWRLYEFVSDVLEIVDELAAGCERAGGAAAERTHEFKTGFMPGSRAGGVTRPKAGAGLR